MRTRMSQIRHERTPNSMTKEDCAQTALSAEHNIEALSGRIIWIANFVPPYAAWMYQNLGERLRDFRLLLSTDMEKGRTWTPDLRLPNTRIQRTLSWTYQSCHPNGFTETLQSHFPYDTIPLLLKEKPKVVISSELGARTVQGLIYRLLFPATRLIVRATVSEISEQGRGRLRNWLRRVVLKYADAVLVNGQSGARYIRTFGVPLEKLFIVPYTTEMTALTRVPLERPIDAAFRMLYVGQLIGRKGLLPFCEILREWALRHESRTLNLWIVGTGDLRDSLGKCVVPGNVTIRFLGTVPYADLPNVFAACGLLVFPTLADEWGMVVNEAMAAGLPVLGSTFSQAVEELIREGQNGWCFRPDSRSEMYSALDRALNTSESKMSEMRRNARMAVGHLTPSYSADRVLDAVRFVSSQRETNERLGCGRDETSSLASVAVRRIKQ
jgi:glycosyltransferase involved in cell wall biosynthesis